jgi:signal transduction histidine kinase
VTSSTERERLALLVHEVRSPVAAIAAIAHVLSYDRPDTGSLRELVRLSVEACRGVERIVGDAALGSVRLEPIDAGRLVKDAVAAAALAGAHVRVTVGADLPAIDSDPLRMRQVLDNLISNALVHSFSDEDVLVGVRAEDTEVLISVSNTGAGIPFEEHSRIFDTGVRLDESRPGSGLGLAVARAIVEAHHGTLTVKSAPGEGATFTITLPRSRRHPAGTASSR